MSVNQVNQTTGALSPIAGGTLYASEPIGSVKIWMSNTIPNGYLLCNGQAISKTTYADLYAVIGSTFGETDTTFNVPDLRGEFLRGAGTNSHTNQGSGGVVGAHQDSTTVPYMSNRADGNTVVTEQVAPTGGSRANVLNSDSAYKITTNSVYGAYQAPLTSTTAAQQLTVRPTNTSVNFIIKATTIALPSDFSDQVDDMIDAKIVNNLASGDMRAATSNTVYNCVTVDPTTEDITSYVNTDVATASGVNVTYFHNKQILINFNNVIPKVAGNGKTLLQNLPFRFAAPQAVSVLAVDISQSATDTHCIIYTNPYNNWFGAHLSGIGKHYYGQIITTIM